MPIKTNSGVFRETSYNFLGRDNGDLEWIPRYGLWVHLRRAFYNAPGLVNLPDGINRRSPYEQLE
ncbi:hypothetical protein PPUJ20066_44340 [Pseudomonas putida]|nr:hypothetical protein PPUJ20066_44340 [Pseudomonas putida]